MHLDEERLQQFLDDQLDPAARAAVLGHLEECSACLRLHATLESDRLDAGRLLGFLDEREHPTPLHVEEVIAQAEARERTLASPGPHPVRWARLAAGVGLAILLVGAAYATPGSPLPGWIDGLVGSMIPRPVSPVPETVRTLPVPPSAPGTAGISLTPGSDMVIEFGNSASVSEARVQLTDGAKLLVLGPQGAATFTTKGSRILIDNRLSTAFFEVKIPRSAIRVELRVVHRTVFLKEGPTITTSGSATSDSTWLVPLGP